MAVRVLSLRRRRRRATVTTTVTATATRWTSLLLVLLVSSSLTLLGFVQGGSEAESSITASSLFEAKAKRWGDVSDYHNQQYDDPNGGHPNLFAEGDPARRMNPFRSDGRNSDDKPEPDENEEEMAALSSPPTTPTAQGVVLEGVTLPVVLRRRMSSNDDDDDDEDDDDDDDDDEDHGDDDDHDDDRHEEEEESYRNSEYGGGLVPEENSDEIDCSIFEHLDELPPFCLPDPTLETQPPFEDEGEAVAAGGQEDTASNGSNNNDDDSSSAPPSDTNSDWETEITFTNDNSIQVPLSLGIHKLDYMSVSRGRVFVSIAVRIMGIMLDRYTPFDVIAPDNDDDEEQNSRDYDGDRRAGRSLRLRDLSGEGGGDQGNSSNGGGGGGGRRNQGSGNNGDGDGDELLARLYFNNVNAWESPVWDNWLQLSVQYVVFWPNGEPVFEERLLDQIGMACRQVLNMTVDANKFWNEMIEADDEMKYVARPGVPWTDAERSAIEAVAKFGDEYMLDPEWHNSDGSPIDGANNNATKAYEGSNGRSYWEPVETEEWEFREWFGLALLAATLFMASLLTAISAHVQRHHHHHHLAKKSLGPWDAAGLTEQGVGELLNIGWAYHQQDGEDGQSGQLFLQVYNKGKLGYSDENSVLQGDVLQHARVLPPPPSPPSGPTDVSTTETSSTPASERTPHR